MEKTLRQSFEEALALAEGMADFAVVKMEERDAAEAKLRTLREAAVAMVAEIENMDSHALIVCDYCRALGMHDAAGGGVACDEHRCNLDEEYDIRELSYAAPLRALRAALK